MSSHDSKYYKSRLLDYLLGGSQMKYIGGVHELSNLNRADVVACEWNGCLSEFEIKITRTDLLGEIRAILRALEPDSVTYRQRFMGLEETTVATYTSLSKTKIEKHRHYLVEPRDHFRPNQFYFAVPNALVEIAVSNLKGLKYGVLDADRLEIVKKAQYLHRYEHNRSVYIDLFKRLSVIFYERGLK